MDISKPQVVVFDEENLDGEERIDAIIASMSVPLGFSPVRLGDMTLVDGGVSSNI